MLKLLAQPIEQMDTVGALDGALDGALGVANRDVLLSGSGKAGAFLLKKDVGGQHQGPEADNRRRAHQLILVEAEQFFRVGKQNLDVPTHGQMADQGRSIRAHLTRGPLPSYSPD